jgi:hypothetical protein
LQARVIPATAAVAPANQISGRARRGKVRILSR